MTAREILARLRSLADQTTASLRAFRRSISRELRTSSGDEVMSVALAMLRGAPEPAPSGVEGPSPAERFVAYELIASHRAAMELLNTKRIEELGKGIDSWSDVDVFAVYLSGPAWREGQISDSVIRRWARSRDRWWRRAALVSTVGLNAKSRGGQGDAPRTLAICSMLIADRDDMVVKAMSWALRELAKRDATAARRFVEENDENLAPRVVREVQNKLRTGRKN